MAGGGIPDEVVQVRRCSEANPSPSHNHDPNHDRTRWCRVKRSEACGSLRLLGIASPSPSPDPSPDPDPDPNPNTGRNPNPNPPGQVDLDRNVVLCNEAQAQAVVLPQKPYSKLYKVSRP
jgi:hypothetical protein